VTGFPKRISFAPWLLVLALVAATPVAAQQTPHPADVFGFEPGSDYNLADYEQLRDFYGQLAAASDRVELVEIGETVRGQPLLLLFISSEENIRQLDRWRSIAARLARADALTDAEARELAREGKAIVWIDSGLHSTEVAHSQHAPLLAHHMVTDESEESRRIRDDVILLLMPIMNPDGHKVVVDWYRKNLGTPYETSSPPELYHQYVGHDNNRDWFMIRQAETEAISRVLYGEWYPQIVYNHHQTAPFPARIFIPPFSDPVNPNIPPLVVRGVNMVGDAMAQRMEQQGMPGVVSRLTFTMWWNGGMRTAPYFHNMIGILSEVGHNSATPLYHEPSSLPETIGSGTAAISATEPSIFHTNPWPGGWARLADAVNYHFVSSLAVLDIGSKYREDWLYNIYQMGRDAIRKGEEGGPYAYVVPLEGQWDAGEAVELLNVLRRGGIEVHRATAPFTAGGERYPAGSYVLKAGQAFRAHLVDMLEPQEHPHVEQYPGGPPVPPYGGLAGWTLPMQMGVTVARVESRFDAALEAVDVVPAPPGRVVGEARYGYVLSEKNNASARAANRLLAAGASVSRTRGRLQLEDARFGPGAYVVQAGTGAGPQQVAEIARELGVDFVGLPSLPSVALDALGMPRVGLYKSWVANMDEGWTRFLLDWYEFPLDTIKDADIRRGDLMEYDVIILPDQSASRILDGHTRRSMPDEYTGGIGTEGAANLKRFVEAGGTLVAFDGATDFAIEHLALPVSNAVSELEQDSFFIPGSLIRTELDSRKPAAWGMPDETGVFFQGSRAFDVDASSAVDVFARYARSNLLMSGWEIGAQEALAGKAAGVTVRLGNGWVTLIGFRPQFRAQPSGTFKLIFNSIHNSALTAPPSPSSRRRRRRSFARSGSARGFLRPKEHRQHI
jgi:hypothetical protein